MPSGPPLGVALRTLGKGEGLDFGEPMDASKNLSQ